MKQNKSDVFFNTCFKVGKILSMIMLVLTLISFCISGITLVCLQPTNIETPIFKTLENEINSKNEINSETTKNKLKDKKTETLATDKEIDRIIKENKLNYQVKNFITKKYLEIPNKLKKRYLTGLDSFCKDGLSTLNKNDKLMRIFNTEYKTDYYGEEYEDSNGPIMNNGVYNLTISKHLVEAYHHYFEENLAAAQIQDQEKIIVKEVTKIVLLISLFLFVMFLFLPVLIKIEENTRKL
ncbi:MAG: hypothetical protein ACI37Z_03160 [Candidatus Gastranaerophilaceae bacterium]